MNVQGLCPSGRVKLVDLGLLLDQVLRHSFVGVLAQAKRLYHIFSHLLLLEVVLPLLILEVLLVDLVQILVHLLVCAQLQVLRVDLFFGLELARFHVFKLCLASNKISSLNASTIVVPEA